MRSCDLVPPDQERRVEATPPWQARKCVLMVGRLVRGKIYRQTPHSTGRRKQGPFHVDTDVVFDGRALLKHLVGSDANECVQLTHSTVVYAMACTSPV